MTQEKKQLNNQKPNKLLIFFVILIILALILSTMGTAIIYMFPWKSKTSNQSSYKISNIKKNI